MAVLVQALLVVGVVVLAVVLVVGWFLIRRDLRPLERVTATASRSLPATCRSAWACLSRRSEVGRLGHAFDSMLDQIEAAFDSQHRALMAKDAVNGNYASSSPTPHTSCARR